MPKTLEIRRPGLRFDAPPIAWVRRLGLAILVCCTLQLVVAPQSGGQRVLAADDIIAPGQSASFAFGDQVPNLPNVWVYVPKSARQGDVLQVLIAAHGMGGKGSAFAAPLVEFADKYRWLLVAPDFAYRDWRDPNQVRTDEVSITPGLVKLFDALPARTGWSTQDRLLLIGFSRGAQLATRFSLFFPEEVIGAAAMSAGTYTLPMETWQVEGKEALLPLPFGVGDLSKSLGRSFDPDAVKLLHFWIAVGGADNNAAELPKQWDPYLGNSRVTRAETFVRFLKELGADASLNVYGGVGHGYTAEELTEAAAYLRDQELSEQAKRSRSAGSLRLQPLAAVERLPASALPAPLPQPKPCGW